MIELLLLPFRIAMLPFKALLSFASFVGTIIAAAICSNLAYYGGAWLSAHHLPTLQWAYVSSFGWFTCAGWAAIAVFCFCLTAGLSDDD
jgi:hypothetical protein